jgi:hypothetical protein
MFLIACLAIRPVLLIAYYTIQRTAGHHSRQETRPMIKDMVVKAMNKHDQDFDD